eukprot:6663247-Pyramimonas_sp.AAC.1
MGLARDWHRRRLPGDDIALPWQPTVWDQRRYIHGDGPAEAQFTRPCASTRGTSLTRVRSRGQHEQSRHAVSDSGRTTSCTPPSRPGRARTTCPE